MLFRLVSKGMMELEYICLICHIDVLDFGITDGYLGPYSPYREIRRMFDRNTLIAFDQRICTHMTNCSICKEVGEAMILHDTMKNRRLVGRIQ